MAEYEPLLVTPRERDLMVGLLQALRNVSGSGGIEVRMTPGQGLSIAYRGNRGRRGAGPGPVEDPATKHAIARLTDTATGTARYQAVEVEWDSSEWVAVEDGKEWATGGTALPALHEINGLEGLTDGGKTPIVIAVQAPNGQWAFSWEGPPPGDGQYKVLQLDSDNNPFWDYVRAY